MARGATIRSRGGLDTGSAVVGQSGAVVPLSDVRPSVSRSDVLGGALIELGVDGGRIARELELALGAVTVERRPVNDARGKYLHHDDFEVPDWKTRMSAIEKIIRIQGWEFEVEKLEAGSVSRDVLMIVRNLTINGRGLSEASIAELSERHRADVSAGLIEEAEAEDGDTQSVV